MVTSEDLYHSGEEVTVGQRPGNHLRAAAHDLVGGVTVGRVVVFPAQPDVVDASRVRDRRVKPGTSVPATGEQARRMYAVARRLGWCAGGHRTTLRTMTQRRQGGWQMLAKISVTLP